MVSEPTHRIRIRNVECWINRRTAADGTTWYSTSFVRHYEDMHGYAKKATTFGRDDLLVLAEVARQAFLWVATQELDVATPELDAQ